MKRWGVIAIVSIGWVFLSVSGARLSASEQLRWQDLEPPVVEGHWVRPAEGSLAQPVWGHADGLRVGLAPLPGPRGLLRIYAPYLDQPATRMINFIAVEPVVAGERRRGLSELEHSDLDDVRGKRFWSANQANAVDPSAPERPARGVVRSDGGTETLEVFVFVEPFNNGAKVYLKLMFRSDHPYEVGLASFVQSDSKPLKYCILTATMGNYARLRQLHLERKIVLSGDLWPEHEGDGFAEHRSFPLEELSRGLQGSAIVAATTDEAEPEEASYAPGTYRGWRYQGKRATQYWRCERPAAELRVQVNGRSMYWASQSAIPGGISYENFELVAPFQQGQESWFGVTPQLPEQLGIAGP